MACIMVQSSELRRERRSLRQAKLVKSEEILFPKIYIHKYKTDYILGHSMSPTSRKNQTRGPYSPLKICGKKEPEISSTISFCPRNVRHH